MHEVAEAPADVCVDGPSGMTNSTTVVAVDRDRAPVRECLRTHDWTNPKVTVGSFGVGRPCPTIGLLSPTW
jgi:hypothetical protein